MFEASTGVPAANASVSTIPKLSPGQRGRAEQVGVVQAAPELVAVDAAERLDARVGAGSAR